MNETKKEQRTYDEIAKEPRPTTEKEPCEPMRPQKEDACELLHIAQKVEEFVNRGGWSWCTMDRVYRILKAAHQ